MTIRKRNSSQICSSYILKMKLEIQGVLRNMTVGEYFKMSSSIIFSCLIPKRIIINIIWQSYYSKIDHRLRYLGVKDFSNELNAKSL